MKVIFLEPPADFLPIRHGFYCPNQGILALAAYLERYGYEVEIMDSFLLRLTWKQVIAQLQNKRPDIICFSSFTYKVYYCMAMAGLIKEALPKSVIIAGGSHFSALPEESLRLCESIDFIVIGEGEETLVELLGELKKKEADRNLAAVKGIAYIKDKDYIRTPQRPFIEDIDSLPLPAYHLLLSKKQKIRYAWSKTIGTAFSRGCSYNCKFCSSSSHWNGKVRRKSTVKIMDEIETLFKLYDKRLFMFYDDDFLYDTSKNMEFLEEIEKRRLKFKYGIRTRVDDIIKNRHLLKRFRDSGLISVGLGVESFRQENLRDWGKNYLTAAFDAAIECLKKERVPLIELYLIFGGLNDDKNSLDEMARKLKKMDLPVFFISFLTPLPNTRIYDQMYSRIKVWDYRQYDFMHPIMPTNHLSISQMRGLISKKFIFWWLNPARLMSSVKDADKLRFHAYRLFMNFRALCNLLKRLIAPKSKSKYACYIEEAYDRHLKYICKKRPKKDFTIFGNRWGFLD